MTACFIVRARVEDAVLRIEFDRWYQQEHLPDAFKAFSSQRAWRGWSDNDPAMHYACYEFADAATARAIPGSEALKRMVAEFDRVWGDRVTRSRDIVEFAQYLEG